MALDMLGSLGFIWGFIGGIFRGIGYFLILAMIGGLGWFGWWYGSYKYKIILKTITSEGIKSINEDMFKYIKDKDGTINIKLRKTGLVLPTPPAAALNLTTKGKQFVQGYLLGGKQVLYLQDETTEESLKTSMPNFKPIDTNYEVHFAKQLENSDKWRRGGWKENIPVIVNAGAAVLIIFILVFWGNRVVQPALESQAITLQAQENQLEFQTKLNEGMTAMAVLWETMTGQKLPPNVTLPQYIEGQKTIGRT